jgi:hypothetical protein
MNAPQAPNKIPVEPKEDTGNKDTFDILGNLNFSRALGIALVLLVCSIGWILVTDGAHIIHNLVRHIINLFRFSRFFPHPNEKFIQLVLIAVFVGWAISRISRNR